MPRIGSQPETGRDMEYRHGLDKREGKAKQKMR